MKRVDISEAWARKYPEQVACAVSLDEDGRATIIALGWAMPTSIKPPLVAISVGHTRYSHECIEKSGEFVLAFPNEHQADAVLFCGTKSGRDVDKFKESGFNPVKADLVEPPLIEDAVINLECKLVGSHRTGDHTIFVGEIVAVHCLEEALNDNGVLKGDNTDVYGFVRGLLIEDGVESFPESICTAGSPVTAARGSY